MWKIREKKNNEKSGFRLRRIRNHTLAIRFWSNGFCDKEEEGSVQVSESPEQASSSEAWTRVHSMFNYVRAMEDPQHPIDTKPQWVVCVQHFRIHSFMACLHGSVTFPLLIAPHKRLGDPIQIIISRSRNERRLHGIGRKSKRTTFVQVILPTKESVFFFQALNLDQAISTIVEFQAKI